jgi:hypothetical protein
MLQEEEQSSSMQPALLLSMARFQLMAVLIPVTTVPVVLVEVFGLLLILSQEQVRSGPMVVVAGRAVGVQEEEESLYSGHPAKGHSVALSRPKGAEVGVVPGDMYGLRAPYMCLQIFGMSSGMRLTL